MTKTLRTARLLEIHDLTDSFRAAKWTGDWRQDERLFDEHVRVIEKGVYVHYLQNKHKHPVYDRNGKGKLLIQPRLGTIKFGKFESGMIRRRSEDVRHMHRRDPHLAGTDTRVFPQAPDTFGECVRLALVLNLTDYDVSITREAESHLRKRIRGFLEGASLSIQDHRGDYRILKGTAPAGVVDKLACWARGAFDEVAREVAK